ncbi:MAG: CDP-glucose 4,6-dehydratase, partial [Solirubrobacteraceae bacterium]|nr:CDP-glucose 4,6-dehydratase [Solirubrobacteraceae bacterium]
PVGWIVGRLAELWPEPLRVATDEGPHPHEARLLSLDSAKARDELGWAPVWDLEAALARTVEWYEALARGADMRAVTLEQTVAFAAS